MASKRKSDISFTFSIQCHMCLHKPLPLINPEGLDCLCHFPLAVVQVICWVLRYDEGQKAFCCSVLVAAALFYCAFMEKKFSL